MKLGEVIRAYRMHRELSLRYVANEIGIGAATLMRFENGQDIDAQTFMKVLTWLTSK